MATLNDVLKYAKENPNDPRNAELFKAIKGGAFDEMAKQEGIDISGIRPEFDLNLGIGFDAPAQRVEGEGFISSATKTLRNTPRSAFEFGKNVISAIASPIETVKTIGSITKGLGGKAGEVALEKTDIGQSLLERISQSRVERGLSPLQKDESGNLQVVDNEDIQMINAVGKFYKDRYGSVENFKESVVEDPVGVLADVAGLVSGVGLGARSAGMVGTGTRISKVGQALEPTNIVGRAVSGTGSALRQSGRLASEVGGDVVRGVVPTTEKLVAQSLDLTAGDLRNIQNKTGQNVSQFVLDKIGDTTDLTPEDIVNRLSNTVDENYNQVRNVIQQINNTYADNDIPRIKQALSKLDELYKDTPGLESVQSEIRNLLSKDGYSLSEVQRTKELLDQADIIFRQSGEVKAGVQSQGLANIRQELKTFIETEVRNNLGDDPATDIARLNNQVQTAREIEDAVLNRSTRDLTRRSLSLTDILAGGLALGGGIDPMTAVGVVLTKKAIESPAFRIALAKKINGLGDNRVAEIFSQIKNNSVTRETQQILIDLMEQAKTESGLTIPIIENIQEINDQTRPSSSL